MRRFTPYAAACLGLFAFTAQAALPTNVTLVDAFEGLASFQSPVGIFEIPGKPGTFAVLEQKVGNVTIVSKNGSSWTKSLMVHVDVTSGTDEMGLLGMAFHPDFASNRKYYLSYNQGANSSTYKSVVEERVADASLIKDAGTAPKVLLTFAQPAVNHNGGTIGFGPKDGYFYVGFGDGGGGGDTYNNSRKKNVFFAKILRIDVDHPAEGKNYGIPADNPFVGQSEFSPEIWAWGVRNPWKWSFDPLTGDFWLGDVGQTAYEEVDIVKAGMDLGWVTFEGKHCNAGTACDTAGITLPILEYGRSIGTCIIGGRVYRGNPNSPFYGAYFYADYGSAHIWAIKVEGRKIVDSVKVVDGMEQSPTTFGTDSQGRIYVAGREGKVYRLESPDLVPTSLDPKKKQLENDVRCCFRKSANGWAFREGFGRGIQSLAILDLRGNTLRRFSGRQIRENTGFQLKPGIYLAHSETDRGMVAQTVFLP